MDKDRLNIASKGAFFSQLADLLQDEFGSKEMHIDVAIDKKTDETTAVVEFPEEDWQCHFSIAENTTSQELAEKVIQLYKNSQGKTSAEGETTKSLILAKLYTVVQLIGEISDELKELH